MICSRDRGGCALFLVIFVKNIVNAEKSCEIMNMNVQNRAANDIERNNRPLFTVCW